MTPFACPPKTNSAPEGIAVIVAPIRTSFCQLSMRSVDFDADVRASSGTRRCSRLAGRSKHVQGLSDVPGTTVVGREKSGLTSGTAEKSRLIVEELVEEVSGLGYAVDSFGLIRERSALGMMLNEGSEIERDDFRGASTISLLRLISFTTQPFTY